MLRVVLRYLDGPRAGEADVLEVDQRAEILLSPAGAALAGPGTPEVARSGRWEARIIPVGAELRHFVLVDLESREGVFVNQRRVKDATLIRSADVVRLGDTGPDIEFTVLSRP